MPLGEQKDRPGAVDDAAHKRQARTHAPTLQIDGACGEALAGSPSNHRGQLRPHHDRNSHGHLAHTQRAQSGVRCLRPGPDGGCCKPRRPLELGGGRLRRPGPGLCRPQVACGLRACARVGALAVQGGTPPVGSGSHHGAGAGLDTPAAAGQLRGAHDHRHSRAEPKHSLQPVALVAPPLRPFFPDRHRPLAEHRVSCRVHQSSRTVVGRSFRDRTHCRCIQAAALPIPGQPRRLPRRECFARPFGRGGQIRAGGSTVGPATSGSCV